MPSPIPFPCWATLAPLPLRHCVWGIKYLFALFRQPLSQWLKRLLPGPEKVKCTESKCFSLVLMLWGWQDCGHSQSTQPWPRSHLSLQCWQRRRLRGSPSLHPAAGWAELAFLPPPAPAVLKLASFYSQPLDLGVAMPQQELSLSPSSLCPGLHCSSILNFIPIHVGSCKALAPAVSRLYLVKKS